MLVNGWTQLRVDVRCRASRRPRGLVRFEGQLPMDRGMASHCREGELHDQEEG